MRMQKSVGLTLRILNDKVVRIATSPKRSHNRTREKEMKKAALEAWFESSGDTPSPTSPIAAKMRELLKLHPQLSFDELRVLAIEKTRRRQPDI
jgi:hypothetical protein